MGVDQELLGKVEAEGHEHGRPVDRVELEDVLAEDLDSWRPLTSEVRIPGHSEIVTQGVNPDIDCLIPVSGHPHPPVESGGRPRHGEVNEALRDPGQHLASEESRGHGGRVLVPSEQSFLTSRSIRRREKLLLALK